MKNFQTNEDLYLEPEFCTFIDKHIPITYIHNIPTFGGTQTFFWSTRKFPDIKKQYIISENIHNPVKYFFVKKGASHATTEKAYHKHFRNQLRKAQLAGLECYLQEQPPAETINELYTTYKENVIRLFGLFIPFQFFKDILSISFSRVIVIRKKEKILSFGSLLGNILFFQASTFEGRQLCANNLLYDYIYALIAPHDTFLGTSIINSGHHHFKCQSGAQAIPVAPTKIDISLFFQKTVSRGNKFTGFFFKHLNEKQTIRYLFPW